MSHSWPRIEELFHAALTRSGEERRRFLDRACDGDPSLREEIEALLESDSRASGFLTAPVIFDLPRSPLVDDSVLAHQPAPDDPAGATRDRPFEFAAHTPIGNYRIVRPLGRGGMGEVYQAEDLTLGRYVALKVLNVVLDSVDARARLLTEARTASSLNHPHIVTIHSIERDRHGRDFLVMEYVEGSTLRERLAARTLEIDELLTIAAQMVDALAAAHVRGIVHRDLKPENVMLTKDGQVKLLDFGIASTARAQSDGEVRPDGPSAIVGTLSYMSPEQAAGQPADFRSDQFSLGSILYEAACGVRPFDRPTAAQTRAAVVRAEMPSLTERCPTLPDPLRWIIERCLARDPDSRYASTKDLHRELTMLRTRLFDVQATSQFAPMPLPRTSLIGRARELATATRLVLETGAHLVTLTGPGGVGKTRLALEVASALSDRFGNRVAFVDLAPVRNADDVGKTLATALGVRDDGEVHIAASLTRWVRERQHSPMLLLIDNFEHVLAAAPLVSELLAASRSLTVLATSRAILRLAGEHDVVVPPLALPDQRQTTVDDVARSPAVTLFVQRAVAAKSDFALTQDNASAVARICERLDGLPLAIELAAARVRLFSPDVILLKLERRLDVLTGGPRDAPQRQQTFRAALEWSEEQLDVPERMLFRRMAVFTGGCTAEGAEAVCNTRHDLSGQVEDLLAGLAEKNMIVLASSDPLRVSQLETIREFALERLAASNDGELARRAHAAYCVVLAEEGFGLRGRQQSEWMDRCEVEYSNYRAAHRWLIGREQFEWGVRLASALMPFWEARALLSEGRQWFDQLLTLPDHVQQVEWRAKALSHICYLIHLQGDMAAWWPLMATTLALFEQLGDRRTLAQLKVNSGIVKAQLGRHDEARADVEAGRALWRDLGDATGEARALANLATLAKLTGDYVRARRLYQHSRERFENNGDAEGISWSFNHEADAARWAGDLPAARGLLEQALDRFRAAGDDAGTATCLADLATINIEQDPAAAAEHGLAALRLLITTGHSREIAHVLETLARVAWQQRAPERALRLAGAAAAIRSKFERYDRLELRHPDDAVALREVIARSREGIGSDAAAVWMDGWSASLRDTVRYALIPQRG